MYIDFLIQLIPTPLVSVLFCSSNPTFCSFKKYIYTVLDIKRVEKAFFHSMYVFLVIFHAIEKQDIST